MKCKNYCGLACVNGSCPIALSEEMAERGIPLTKNCEECSSNKQCEDCIMSGDCRFENLIFTWEKESKNENAIALFKEKGIDWQYSKYQNLQIRCESGYRDIEYSDLGDNRFRIILK